MFEGSEVKSRQDLLRETVKRKLSPRRFSHTLGVERMAAELAVLYCPEKGDLLRAAALLHDITKEESPAAQKTIFARHGILLRADEEASPKIWHGISAALVIPEWFPEFASPELISAVRWHTTGRAGMSLCEAILYLADYIEEGRTFPDCVTLRHRFWDAAPQQMDPEERRAHLADVLRESFRMTLAALAGEGSSISRDTEEALCWLNEEKLPF